MTINCDLQIDAERLSEVLELDEPTLARWLYRLRRLLGPVDLRGKRVLEIGCGRGTYCLLMACHGAAEVVGLEPEAHGGTNGTFQIFEQRIDRLGATAIRPCNMSLNEYDLSASGSFDIILAHNVVNHLDEQAVQRLHRDEGARRAYQRIFTSLRQGLAASGVLVLSDCGRRNICGDLLPRSMWKWFSNENIEWDKHQSAFLWRRLLEQAGFQPVHIEYYVPYGLRRLPLLANNRLFSYFTTSSFTIRAYGGLGPC